MRINQNKEFKCLKWFFLVVLSLFILPAAYSQTVNIKNDKFWKTINGQPIYSQGGGIFKFADPLTGLQKYYWYGVHYKEADIYLQNPSVTQTKSTFKAVTCYSSTDLVNWKFEGDVLSEDSVNVHGKTWLGRLGVAYIPEIKKYALFTQYGGSVLVALANSPTAQFQWDHQINMQPMIGTSNTGDQTVFTDEDTGKSYLVYSYGRGRNKIYISEIGIKDGKVGLLDCTQVFQGESREGNCMFKYQGKYYMCASNIYGWDASYAYYLVADSINGPYLPSNNMLVINGVSADFTHISQTGFFYTIKGSKQETVIYCGDRWADFAGNGLGYNQWCPISFEGTVPYFNSLNSWSLDVKTGAWQVAKDNNFVMNASFEADRKRIPSAIKPIQEQLTGWETMVLTGNKIEIDSTNGPALNHFNNQTDREIVIGEKSLNLTDKVDFKRKVFQKITSSPFVKLADGNYTLTAKVKNSKGFSHLEMYASNQIKNFKYTISGEHTGWQTISISKISIKNGQLEIGFFADGLAHAFCLIDDVSLVKE